jgi:glycosyltransferase involved in cell wall biosynthesis
MKFLLLNQTFYPDVMATGQYLTEVAVGLAERGHEVTVLTSRRAYDAPDRQFPANETWRGIRIVRIASTGFGKTSKWRRAVDFASFLVSAAFHLLRTPRQDAILALTSPPLISFLGAFFTKLRGGRFFYWVMDFNPDEAIAAGWLRANSLAARILDRMSRYSLKRATTVIALDRFMRDRIVAKRVEAGKVLVLPPWSHDNEVSFDPEGRERFRKAHGLQDKFVVMYSGNHSPCHPLDTLLAVADRLRDQRDIVFCFVGGGSEFAKVQALATAGRAKPNEATSIARAPNHPSTLGSNLLCLPYQPLDQLSASLSAADLHVVVMGDAFVGLVHPCKIYNILATGAPVLGFGPDASHLADIFSGLEPEYPRLLVTHGATEQAADFVLSLRQPRPGYLRRVPASLSHDFSQKAVLPQLLHALESKE